MDTTGQLPLLIELMEAVVLPAAKIGNGVRRMGKQILNQYMLICVESVQKPKIPYPADVKAYI